MKTSEEGQINRPITGLHTWSVDIFRKRVRISGKRHFSQMFLSSFAFSVTSVIWLHDTREQADIFGAKVKYEYIWMDGQHRELYTFKGIQVFC